MKSSFSSSSSSMDSRLPYKGLSGIFLYSLFLTFLLSLLYLYSAYPVRRISPPARQFFINRQHATIKHPIKDRIDENCDLFKGRWIPDPEDPPYNSTSCLTIPDSKNCIKNGRNDTDFLHWRWKPDGCELLRFDPVKFLGIVKDKTLAFVGDSVARNQMESLLCLLSKVEAPLDKYKDSDDRFRTWYFPLSNFTLMILWSRFLIRHDERIINGTSTGNFDLHLDMVDQDWASRLHDIDYLILSDAHWFFRKNYLYDHNKLVGCVYCDELDIPKKSLNYAIRMAFQTALSHIGQCESNCGELLTVLRTFSPAHFENGAWDSGGNCNRTRPFSNAEAAHYFKGLEWEIREIQVDELEKVNKEGNTKVLMKKRYRALDMTSVMLMRPDGHPNSHWANQWMKGFNDCVHWCMPGPVDTWNQLLLAIIERDANF